MSRSEILIYIIIPLISSFIGGGLTVLGVLISIRGETKIRKEQIIKENKPLIYLINPWQNYDYKSVQQFVFKNKNVISEKNVEILLKNTDNAIMIMNNVKVDNIEYYAVNGNVVDKNSLISIRIHFDSKIKNLIDSAVILSINDAIGNEYKYILGFSSEDSEYIDSIKEIV